MISLQKVHFNPINLYFSIKTRLKLIPSLKNIEFAKNWYILGLVYELATAKGEILLI